MELQARNIPWIIDKPELVKSIFLKIKVLGDAGGEEPQDLYETNFS